MGISKHWIDARQGSAKFNLGSRQPVSTYDSECFVFLGNFVFLFTFCPFFDSSKTNKTLYICELYFGNFGGGRLTLLLSYNFALSTILWAKWNRIVKQSYLLSPLDVIYSCSKRREMGANSQFHPWNTVVVSLPLLSSVGQIQHCMQQ